MAKKKHKHGGKRPGAGRKVKHPEGATLVIPASVPEVLVAKLDVWAEKHEMNQSEAVTEAIRRLVK